MGEPKTVLSRDWQTDRHLLQTPLLPSPRLYMSLGKELVYMADAAAFVAATHRTYPLITGPGGQRDSNK